MVDTSVKSIQYIDIEDFYKHFQIIQLRYSEPIVLTHQGKSVGYFVPTQPKRDGQDFIEFHEKMDALARELDTKNIDIEEIIAEFKALRKQDKS
jgi:hypothetical protein